VEGRQEKGVRFFWNARKSLLSKSNIGVDFFAMAIRERKRLIKIFGGFISRIS
jgi:hypothetical protein